MKKALLIIGIAGCLGFAGCEAAYVSEQPADVVYERPAAPGDGYVWIEGDWVWGGGGYHWHGGHWERARNGRAWNGGHWDHTARGYHWNHGYWK